MAAVIKVSVSGLREALGQVKNIQELVKSDDGRSRVATGAVNVMGEGFRKNFIAEGSMVGGWADLAERTVADREERGFGGEHPILIRYGGLIDTTTTALSKVKNSTTFYSTDPDGKAIGVTVQIGNGAVIASAYGEKSTNQVQTDSAPARPFWFTNAVSKGWARDGAVRTLEEEIKRAIG